MLSPNIMAYRSASAFISLNEARTETGSVALIRLPKANASFQVKSGLRGVYPISQNIMELLKIAIKVPMKLNIRTVPRFLKNDFLFMLYPDSKMIGGSNKIIKIPLKWPDRFRMYIVTFI
jgi:hypothetical protein